MADTKIQKKVEDWIREDYLAQRFDKEFCEKKLVLKWGGEFNFDAVSHDGVVVANISSSAAKTSTGKSASGKTLKIKSDTLYLMNVSDSSKRIRIQIFTEKTMFDHFQQEVKNGRYPGDIELIHVNFPSDLQKQIEEVRNEAVREVTPL